jgi:hypothetical protein
MENKENLTGRWLKCIKSDWVDVNFKKLSPNEYIGIDYIDSDGDFIVCQRKTCISKSRLSNGEFELMPEGFNPNNIEKEFVLPEEWYLEVTENSVGYIQTYRLMKDIHTRLKVGDYKYISTSGYGLDEYHIKSLSNTITLDQFKKYVLKINDNVVANKKWNINDLRGKSDFVIKCTKVEQINKLRYLNITDVLGDILINCKVEVAIYCDRSGFDKISTVENYINNNIVKIIDYNDIIFNDNKPGINSESIKVELKDSNFIDDNFLTADQLVEEEVYSHYNRSKRDRFIIGRYSKGNIWYNVLFENIGSYNDRHILSCSCYFKKATPDERKWLNKCIEANKFIPKEDASNTFKKDNGLLGQIVQSRDKLLHQKPLIIKSKSNKSKLIIINQ